jgi:Mrp family chromosome partitioning ATPase
MSSSVEKAIEKARLAHEQRRGQPGGALPGAPEASGLFRILSLASVRKDTMERNKIIPAVEDRSAITAYKVLRTRILQRLRNNHWRNFVVSGAGPGEGKTLTACNLAVSIAKDVNQSVFLVDLDLQRSNVANYFGLDINLGIGDYLSGRAEIEDIVYAPQDMDRIAIIPNRGPVENSSELIASPRMKALVKWLKDRGSAPFTIFDMPPILSCDDVLAFLPSVDALLMVVSEGITERSQLARAIEMIGDVNLLGVVLNRSREHRNTSAYY